MCKYWIRASKLVYKSFLSICRIGRNPTNGPIFDKVGVAREWSWCTVEMAGCVQTRGDLKGLNSRSLALRQAIYVIFLIDFWVEYLV